MEYRRLKSGGKMPMVGYGTLFSKGNDLEVALNKALECGYRHIDTAHTYMNESIIGKVLNEWISSGRVTRDELFIVSKLPPYGVRYEDVDKYIKQSLQDLKVDYLDMYIIHTPFGVFKDGKSEYVEMKRDDSTNHLKVWKAMEEQVDNGRTKAIGLSNFNVTQIKRILDNCKIRPEYLQVENHLYLQEPELLTFCEDNGIAMTAYSCLGTKDGRKLMGMSWTNKQLPEMLDNEVLQKIAKKYGKTPAQVLLRFIVQKNITVIPKSTNLKRLVENIKIFDFKLDAEDMKFLRDQDSGEGGRIARFLFFPEITGHPEYPFLVQN